MAERPKVVSLRGDNIPLAVGEAVPSVVAEAERVLEMARSGEITGLAVVLRHADECVSSNFVGLVGRYVLGEMLLLQSKIVEHLRNQ